MALADRIFDETQIPTFVLKINGETIAPSADPLSLSGTPGVLSLSGGESFDSPVPFLDVEVNRIPGRIQRGHSVTLDAGYSNEHIRQFTGGVLARGDEDPSYLRTQCFVRGRVDPDTGDPIEATASVISGPTTWPAVPAGEYIDFGVDNHLVWDTPTASEMALRELGIQAYIPRRPSGRIDSQIVRCVGDLWGAFSQYKIPPRDLGGESSNDAIAQALTDSGVASYQITLDDYTLADDAELDRMPGAQMIAQLMQIRGGMMQQLRTGQVLIRSLTPFPSNTSAFAYSTAPAFQDICRLIDVTGELRVPFNPLLQIGQTIGVDITHLGVRGRWFLWGHRWEMGPQGAYSYLDLRGGEDFGSTIGVNPIAAFTFAVEREPVGDADYAIITLDATASSDDDGSIVSYAWSTTETTTPDLNTLTEPVVTILVDPTTLVDGVLPVTLTVTDNDGLTGVSSFDVPVEVSSSAVQTPALAAASGTHSMVSPDRGMTWNDLTERDGMRSVDFKPTDEGIVVFGNDDGSSWRSDDFGLSLSQVRPTAGGAVNDTWWDKNVLSDCWQCTADGKLERSQDQALTFATHKDFGGTYPLNRIATPAGAPSVWVFGGRGDVSSTLVQYDAALTGTFTSLAIGGELAVDLIGAGAGITVAAAASRVANSLMLIFKGGLLGSGVNIFYTADALGDGSGWKRCTGLDANLSEGRFVVPDLSGTLYHASFDNRDVWHIDVSSGVPVATKTADVRPAGFEPNHSLWFGEFIGDFSGVFLEAAEDATGTGAIFKSVDAYETVADFRPLTGISTWPAGAKAKQVAIGLAGGSVDSGGRVAALGTDPAVDIEFTKLLGTGAWSDPVIATGLTGDEPRLYCLTPNLFFAADATNNHDRATLVGGDAAWGVGARSKDGGATWDAVPDPGIGTNGGIHSMAIDAGGRVWCMVHKLVGGKIETHIFWSDDQMDTWNFSESFATGGQDIVGWAICPHPTNQNVIAIVATQDDPSGDTFVWSTSDRGANWNTETPTDFWRAATDAFYYGARMLANGRLLIAGKFNLTSDDWALLYTDDMGATVVESWASGTFRTTPGLWASVSGGDVALLVVETSGPPWDKLLLTSNDSGNTIDEVDITDAVDAIASSSGITHIAAARDHNAIYVLYGPAVGCVSIDPTTGEVTDITLNYPHSQAGVNNVCAVPQ